MAGCRRAVTDERPAAPPPPPAEAEPTLAQVTLRLLALLMAAAGAGWVFERLGVPLPWMIGPLVLTALLSISGLIRAYVPNRIRAGGQIVVACQVGLAFSPAALSQMIALGPYLVGTTLLTLASVGATAVIMARLTGQGMAQWFLGMVPTSPVEAATIALKSNIAPMQVVLAQSLRLAAVVVVVPLAIYTIEGWPTGDGRTGMDLTADFDPLDVLILAALGLGAAGLMRLTRLSNPNFLGPLAVTAVLAAAGLGITPFPDLIFALAQIVLGTWLGATFKPDFLRSGVRDLMSTLAATLLLLALCSLAAAGLAYLAGHNWREFVLGAAPGGVAEMALTAQYLGQDVALIAAFHVTRIFILMPNIPWVVALIHRYETRRHRAPPP